MADKVVRKIARSLWPCMARTPSTIALMIACLHFRACALSTRLTVLSVSLDWRLFMSPSAAPMSVRAFFMSWWGFWVNWVNLKCARKVTFLWLVYSLARRTASYQWPLMKPLLMAFEESWLVIVYGPCELEDNCRSEVLD